MFSLNRRIPPRFTLVLVLVGFTAACVSTTRGNPVELTPAALKAEVTVEPSLTSTTAATSTPIGSGHLPVVAYITEQRDGQDHHEVIKIIELISEQEIASFSVESVGSWQSLRFSPDGMLLAYLAQNEVQGSSVYIYNIKTETQKEIFELPDKAVLETLEWSPSAKYISYTFHIDRDSTQHWVFNLSDETSTYVSRGYWGNWLPNDDIYYFQNNGGAQLLYDPLANEQTAAPQWNMTNSSIESHDSHFTNYGCSICYIAIDNAFELEGWRWGGNEVFYHLFDADSLIEKAFVAHFVTERQIPDNYQIDFKGVVPLERGDYLLLIREYVDANRESGIYTIWNPSGRLPIEVSDLTDANRFPEIMPIAVSKDEQYFFGLRVSQKPGELPSFDILIIDIHTTLVTYQYSIRYSYPISIELGDALFWSNTLFSQGEQPLAIDAFWK